MNTIAPNRYLYLSPMANGSPIVLYCRVRREHLLDLFCVTVDITASAVMQIQIVFKVFIVCQIRHPAQSYNLYLLL